MGAGRIGSRSQACCTGIVQQGAIPLLSDLVFTEAKRLQHDGLLASNQLERFCDVRADAHKILSMSPSHARRIVTSLSHIST